MHLIKLGPIFCNPNYSKEFGRGESHCELHSGGQSYSDMCAQEELYISFSNDRTSV